MTDGADKGREPGGWELLRAVQDVKATIADMSRGFVQLAVKEARAETVAVKVETDKKIDDARKEAASAAASIRTELDNAKKTRAQTWTAIGLLAAGGAVGLFYDIFTRGLGMGG